MNTLLFWTLEDVFRGAILQTSCLHDTRNGNCNSAVVQPFKLNSGLLSKIESHDITGTIIIGEHNSSRRI